MREATRCSTCSVAADTVTVRGVLGREASCKRAGVRGEEGEDEEERKMKKK